MEEAIEQWLQNIYSNKPRFTKSFSSRFYQVRESGVFEDAEGGSLDLEGAPADDFVPIQISVSHNGAIERINVLWNFGERTITPEAFAKIVLEDRGWPVSHEQEILYAVKKAIEGHRKFALEFDPSFEELFVTVELNILEDGVKVADRFEWDLFEESNSPGDFAASLAADLGLPRKFEGLIAFEIHRQLYNFKKYLSQKDASQNCESVTRQKKIRGVRENNFFKMPELIRREPTVDSTLFRQTKQIEAWGPSVQFLNS